MFRVLSIDWGSRFEALFDAVEHPTKALEKIGVLLKARTQGAWKDQGRPAGTWAPRAVPNVPGILKDFHDGSSAPKDRRFEPRPALYDEGTMQKGVNYQLKSPTRLEVGMSGPAQSYVDKHQEGGESDTLPNTPEFKAWLWTWLKGPGSEWKGRLGYLLNKNRVGPERWNITARPMFVLLPEDVEDIATLTGVTIVSQAVA